MSGCRDEPKGRSHFRGFCCLSDFELFELLGEDCPGGDLTTETLGLGGCPARLEFSARGPMTVCGTEEAARMFELVGAGVELAAGSGLTVGAGALLLKAQGSASALHRVWKCAQTLVEMSSGISCAAQSIVAALASAGFSIPVACTRKNFPGTKALSVKAVKAGGAILHRQGLSETLLIFPEHLLFCRDTPEAIIRSSRRSQPEKKVAVEVKSAAEALLWARAGAEVLQFEKFSPLQFGECVTQIRAALGERSPRCAAAGGVHAGNALEYARAGADFLVTSNPYSAPPADVQVRFFPD